MPSKSEQRRLDAIEKDNRTESTAEELQNFNYPSLGGAVIRAKNQQEADKIAAKLSEDLKKQADADSPEA